MTERKKLKTGLITLGVLLGTFLFGGSLWGIDNIDTILTNIIQKKSILKQDSDSFKQWSNSSVPIYLSVYLFNITNKNEVRLNNATPHYEEIGPYIYLQKRMKLNPTFEKEGEVLAYQEKRHYTFVPELSKGDPSTDIIHTLNIVEAIAAQKKAGWLAKIFIQGLLTNPFMEKKVEEFLWGYKDKIIEIENKNARAGMFVGLNDTISKVNKINTGLNNPGDIGKVLMTNGIEELNVWTSPYANTINGTDGSMFAPGLKEILPLYVFSADVCRSFKLILKKKVESEIDGRIKLWVYTGSPEQSLNATMNPDNEGFCVKDPIGPKCPLAGLMDLSECKKKDEKTKVPLYASQPRFYKADPKVFKRIAGLKPATDEDQTRLYIHPLTGYPLKADKRIQMNFYLKTDPYFSKFYKEMEGEYYVPLLWLRESAEANSTILNMIYNKVEYGKKKLLTIFYIGLAFGLCLVIFSFTYAIYLAFRPAKKNINFKNPRQSLPNQEIL